VRAKTLSTDGGRRFILVFEAGEEVMARLTGFAREHGISAASFTGIGAFSDVELGYFDWEAKEYRPIALDEQVEVLALTGDVALDDSEPSVHAHVVVGRRDGSAAGGHLLAAHVRPTLELVFAEAPVELRKRYDRETGLALIDLGEERGGEVDLPQVPEIDVAGGQARAVVEAEQAPRGSGEEGA
jgi:predicted DNA-binding protein with PD1-like motif